MRLRALPPPVQGTAAVVSYCIPSSTKTQVAAAQVPPTSANTNNLNPGVTICAWGRTEAVTAAHNHVGLAAAVLRLV
jgi:hypothetical protein